MNWNDDIVTTILDNDDLVKAMDAPNHAQLIPWVAVNHTKECITFFAGDGHAYAHRLSSFQPNGNGVSPDFRNVSIIDYGQAIRFGEYEVSAESIIHSRAGYKIQND